MKNSILFVEGAHDATFFGHLLKRRGYREITHLNDVPTFWRPLIPRTYPTDPEGRLGKIISFPNIYINRTDDTVGIDVTGGDDKIIPTLQKRLEALGAKNFFGIGIVVDTDHETSVTGRFQSCIDRLSRINSAATAETVPGFPIPVPAAPGVVTAGAPKIGIHLFPNNVDCGTLETVLLACIKSNSPRLYHCADEVVGYVAGRAKADDKDVKRLRSPAGKDKAVAGVIANFLQPGASLATSLRSDAWLRDGTSDHPALVAADDFLSGLL